MRIKCSTSIEYTILLRLLNQNVSDASLKKIARKIRAVKHQNTPEVFENRLKRVQNLVGKIKSSQVRDKISKVIVDSIGDAIFSSSVNVQKYENKPISHLKLFNRTEMDLGKEKSSLTGFHGYINNFRDTGEPALSLHGSEVEQFSFDVGLKLLRGKGDSVFYISSSANALVKYLKKRFHLDLKNSDVPLHVLSCHGHQHGAALAQAFNRPVYTYSKGLVFVNELKHYLLNKNTTVNEKNGDVAIPTLHYPNRSIAWSGSSIII